MQEEGNRNARERRQPDQVADDHDRAPPQAIDVDARHQPKHWEGKVLERGQQADLERTRAQDENRNRRQREHADLAAGLADALAEPELQELRVAPKLAPQHGS